MRVHEGRTGRRGREREKERDSPPGGAGGALFGVSSAEGVRSLMPARGPLRAAPWPRAYGSAAGLCGEAYKNRLSAPVPSLARAPFRAETELRLGGRLSAFGLIWSPARLMEYCSRCSIALAVDARGLDVRFFLRKKL